MAKPILVNQKFKVNVKRNFFGWGKKLFREKKGLLLFSFTTITALIIIGALSIYYIALPLQRVSNSWDKIKENISQLQTDFQNKDVSKLDQYMVNISGETAKINQELDQYKFLDNLKFTQGYYQNLQVVKQLISQTEALVNNNLKDTKDILKAAGYKTTASETAITTEISTQDMMKQLPKVVKLYEKAEPEILELLKTFNKIDPEYVPSFVGNYRERVIEVQALATDYPEISAQLKEPLNILPKLLGADKPARYLVIFQNEKEIRAAGGIAGAYGIVTVDKGEIVGEINTIDTWVLERYLRETRGINVGPANFSRSNSYPPHVNKYYGYYQNTFGYLAMTLRGCGYSVMRSQNSGIYPDHQFAINIFRDYYDRAKRYRPNQFPDYDHVLLINTEFAADLLSIIGEVHVQEYKRRVRPESVAKDIFLETSTAAAFDPKRKSFLGALAQKSKEKFYELPSDKYPDAVNTMLDSIQDRNISFFSKDAAVQNTLEALGMTGRSNISFAGDYFHLSEQQSCAQKSNFYVYDTVTQDINIASNGSISKRVNVHWVNEKVYDPAEEHIMSATGNYKYRAWVRVMAPLGSDFTGTDGYSASDYIYRPQEYDDPVMKKRVSDNAIRFDHRRMKPSDPIRTEDLNVAYNLPASIKYTAEKGYQMLIEKHPGKAAEKYIININYQGKAYRSEFNLDHNKIVKFDGTKIEVIDHEHRLDEYKVLMDRLKAELTD